MILPAVDKVIETLPPRVLARLPKKTPRLFFEWKREEGFRRVVRYAAARSPFYRRKFEELKIDASKVNTPKDLGNFYTTPTDIIEHAEDFLCKSPEQVFESSGTTGRNKRVYFSQEELYDIGRYNAAGLFLGGVTRKDRMVNAFDFCFWIPGMVTHKAIEKGGFLGMTAGKTDPIEVYNRMAAYKFTIVLGEPTWLIKLTELAEKNGSYPLRFIIGGGEEMPDAARPWMEKVWQGAQVRMVYATVESGGIIAFEPFKECGTYHINENNFYFEIADPNEEGYGEVTFTTLNRLTMPLIRYRNRDISKIINERCVCGLPYRKMAKIRGRADEMVVASGGNLYPLMFENILKDVPEVTTDWQIIFKLSGIKEIMEFNLEPRQGGTEERIKERVFDGMKAKYPDLWKNYQLGIFSIEFSHHPINSIRKGRKLIHMIDKRYTR